MSFLKRKSAIPAALIAIGALTANSVFSGALEISPAATASYDESPSSIIIEYEIGHNLVPTETTPRLRVFGDGRVEVFYPNYMKKAGRYSYQLDTAELQEVLDRLVSAGLASTTTQSYQDSVSELRSDAELIHVSDPTTFSVKLNLLAGESGNQGEQVNVSANLVASELQVWRSRQSDDSFIGRLGSGFDVLAALAADTRMVKQ